MDFFSYVVVLAMTLFALVVSTVVVRNRRNSPSSSARFGGGPTFSTRFASVVAAAAPTEEAPEKFDMVIAGCGVAGSGVAKAMADRGMRVLVIERDLREPNRIVGELMQPGGLRALDALGLGDCVEGIESLYTYGYAIHNGKEEPLVLELSDPVTGKQHTARTFHYGRFIQNLRRAVMRTPGVTVRQGIVMETVEQDNTVLGVSYKTEDGAKRHAYAPLTVIADGCFSRFRKGLVKSDGDIASYFVGIVINDRTALPYPDHGNVILAEPTPVLAYPIGPNEVRVLIDIPKPLPSGDDLKNYIIERIVPQLPGALGPALVREIEADAPIRSMPNLRLHPQPVRKRGVLLLGDSWNCRHPLTGGGMTVALNDVVLVRNALADLPDFNDYGRVERALESKFYAERTNFSATINILSFALYKVFSAGSDADSAEVRRRLRDACFGYLRLGGSCSRDPMSMLMGLIHSPAPLIRHFFQVALYGSVKLLAPYPTPSSVVLGAKVLWTATEIIAPLMYNEMLARPVYSEFDSPSPTAASGVPTES
jgi:squalene monooxygenase